MASTEIRSIGEATVKVFGLIVIHPENLGSDAKGTGRGGRWTWNIHLSCCDKPFRDDARIESQWSYQTSRTASIAAERWARRCGVSVLKTQQENVRPESK